MNTPARAVLRIGAVVLPIGALAAILVTAGETLGYDYDAYIGAASRLVNGQPLYDPAVDLAGGHAVFLYPPPFALFMVPFTALPASLGPWPWIALLAIAFVAGVAALPVSSDVRWAVLLVGGIEWPVLYGLKLGQVSALLFLLFALAWRWLDREGPLGASVAAGTLVKLQPALLVPWMALTGRLRGTVVAIVVISAAAAVTTALVGPAAWRDYLNLLSRVSAPVTTPHNFTPGAIAFQLGAIEQVASTTQLAATVLTLVAVLVAIRWTSAEVSLLVTIVASQLLSPLLWDHYAVVLLLPVAWLLERRQWWALALPLALSLPLVGFTPAAVYPIAFGIGLLAPIVVGWGRPAETAEARRVPTWVG